MEKINQEILDNAHHILFKMLCEVDRIFRKYNVRYFLAFGTLLGAVRHKGFIPWDDDVDIHVFNEDYDLGMRSLREELDNEEFVLHDHIIDPMYWCTFARVKSIKTEIVMKGIDKEKNFMFKGLHVALLRAPSTKRFNRITFKLIKELNHSHNYNKYRRNIPSLLKLCVSKVSLPVSKQVFSLIEALPGEKIRILGNNAWTGQYYKEEEIVPFCELEFEGKLFYAPKEYRKVLEDAYGEDYLVLPPEEKREVHYREIIFK